MKAVVIGDIHGRNVWRRIVENDTESHFIFLGDYIDPYSFELINEDECFENFEDLIDFKKKNPDRVTFLIGNHDAQYLNYPNFGASRLSRHYLQESLDLFRINFDLFQYAFQIENNLFIHAGITTGWYKDYEFVLLKYGLLPDLSNIADVINKIGNSPKVEIFDVVSYYRGGTSLNGSPIWADENEFIGRRNPGYLPGLHQFVGHNKQKNIRKIGDSISSITFCDCLWNKVNTATLKID